MDEMSMELQEAGSSDVSSDHEGDLVLPEEWFTVDDVEVLELVKAGSPSTQKSINENLNISPKNSNVQIAIENNQCVSTDESSLKTNVEAVMNDTEINNLDDEAKCKGNKSILQSDLSHSEYNNSNFSDIKTVVQTNEKMNCNTDITSNSKSDLEVF